MKDLERDKVAEDRDRETVRRVKKLREHGVATFRDESNDHAARRRIALREFANEEVRRG